MERERRIQSGIRPVRPGSGSGERARRRAVFASEPSASELPTPAVLAAGRRRAASRDLTNALDVDGVVSLFLPFGGDSSRNYDRAGIEAAGLGLVDELGRFGDPAALVVLRGFAAVGHASLSAA